MLYRFDRFELDEAARQLRRDSAPVSLQPLVFNLLSLLVRQRRRVVSKDELLDALWPGVSVTESSLQRAVSLARTALGDRRHTLIRTAVAYGYQFCGEVEADGGADDRGGSEPAAASGPEPAVRYARTRDGVSIAYWTLGEGDPLVYVPNLIWSHGVREWQVPEIRRWYRRLARGRRLVRLDPRGTGSSERRLGHYSAEAVQHDVEAVVARLGLDRFSMFGDVTGGPVVIRYAASHPDRVSRLILWHGFARDADIRGPRLDMLESLHPLMLNDWETYTETRAHMGFGWSDGESAHRYAALMRDSVDPETAFGTYRALRREDVTALLPRIPSPALLLHRRGFHLWTIDASRNLAARLPDARLVVLDGAASTPFLGGVDRTLAAIDAFLGAGVRV